ncbi:MAG: hypothetical protein NKF70_13855 [Methanobacterium sp. ERen5]|nr:MAG: hypothetical protein NKF70_13855 [Methanobacterium sp. ERen5]
MDKHGQISAEFILIMGIGIITTILFTHASFEAIELNTVMTAARNGVTEGIVLDSLAVYHLKNLKNILNPIPG